MARNLGRLCEWERLSLKTRDSFVTCSGPEGRTASWFRRYQDGECEAFAEYDPFGVARVLENQLMLLQRCYSWSVEVRRKRPRDGQWAGTITIPRGLGLTVHCSFQVGLAYTFNLNGEQIFPMLFSSHPATCSDKSLTANCSAPSTSRLKRSTADVLPYLLR
jgi:hypothetical protein